MRTGLNNLTASLCLLAVLSLGSVPAFAMIRGGAGNQSIADPGWPKGAEAVFNHAGRTAWWEGPPFGGGEWHAECKGDEATLSEVLKAFAKIDIAKKRLIVLDGLGYSFWLDPGGEKRGDRATKIDWSFTIWQLDRWNIQKGLPVGMSSIPHDQEEPIALITVHTAGLKWSEVEVPEGIEVVDNRLENHGFKLSDGRVIEGDVTAAPDKPLPATIRIEQITPKKSGGYDYQVLQTIETDSKGHWTIKNFGDQWCRLIAERAGYASRIIDYVHYDRQPGWEHVSTILAPAATVEGRVLDEEDKPLAEVTVTLSDLAETNGGRYQIVDEEGLKTDANGAFRIKNLPHGKARVYAQHPKYFVEGLGQEITIPGEPLMLRMSKAAKLIVQVEFSRDRGSHQYMAKLTPEGGDKIGSWGGSATVGSDNTVTFETMPPGKYTLMVHPNPSSDADRKHEQVVELASGKVTTVVVKQDVREE